MTFSPEVTYARLFPKTGRWNFVVPPVLGTVIGTKVVPLGTAWKATSPLLLSAIQTTPVPGWPFKLVTVGVPWQPNVVLVCAANLKFGLPSASDVKA